MSTQPVKRLSQLEIDEVSLVDRPANQHGLVTITKRDEGTGMAFYDQQGNPVNEDDLRSGDIVFDDQGDPIQLFSDEDLEALVQSGQIDAEAIEFADEDDRELASVGKRHGGNGAAVTGGRSTVTEVRHGRSTKRLGFGGRGRGHVGKSLGEQVLSDLSKALNDNDRDQIISKAMDRVSAAEEAALEAISKAEELEAEAEFMEYCEVAKSFELPVETDELGDLLYAVSKSLNDDQLSLFERILHTASAAVAAELQEIGSAGYSPTMGYVGEVAQEVVGKSAGELTEAQATVALMSANPDVYLDYLSENQR